MTLTGAITCVGTNPNVPIVPNLELLVVDRFARIRTWLVYDRDARSEVIE